MALALSKCWCIVKINEVREWAEIIFSDTLSHYSEGFPKMQIRFDKDDGTLSDPNWYIPWCLHKLGLKEVEESFAIK